MLTGSCDISLHVIASGWKYWVQFFPFILTTKCIGIGQAGILSKCSLSLEKSKLDLFVGYKIKPIALEALC